MEDNVPDTVEQSADVVADRARLVCAGDVTLAVESR